MKMMMKTAMILSKNHGSNPVDRDEPNQTHTLPNYTVSIWGPSAERCVGFSTDAAATANNGIMCSFDI